MPWGTRLIPADELERLLTERRQAARARPQPSTPGRPPAVPPELARRLRAERAAGKSLRQIAEDLNASGTPTAHGGAQWWPSTIRALLARKSEEHAGLRAGVQGGASFHRDTRRVAPRSARETPG
ncbi:MAG: recombinase family protein [Chloroflexota bacterium]|nr:recombinase family protein [Chloroflexota bacterium]